MVSAAAQQGLRVVVSSRNRVKIDAVAGALRQALPHVHHHVQGALPFYHFRRPVLLPLSPMPAPESRLIPPRPTCQPVPPAGSESESGVPDQPFGDEETLRGAFNRVSSIAPRHQDGSSLLVAIEGGVGLVAPLPPQQAAAPAAASSSQQQDQGGLHALRQRLRPGERLPQLECFAWVVVQAPCGATSHARSASFPLPPAVSELMLREGLELGDADDAVFGRWVPNSFRVSPSAATV